MRSSAYSSRKKRSTRSKSPAFAAAASSLMSPPAQNPLSPAPARRTKRHASSSMASLKRDATRRTMARLRLFMAAGRFSTTDTIPRRRCAITSGNACPSVFMLEGPVPFGCEMSMNRTVHSFSEEVNYNSVPWLQSLAHRESIRPWPGTARAHWARVYRPHPVDKSRRRDRMLPCRPRSDILRQGPPSPTR